MIWKLSGHDHTESPQDGECMEHCEGKDHSAGDISLECEGAVSGDQHQQRENREEISSLYAFDYQRGFRGPVKHDS